MKYILIILLALVACKGEKKEEDWKRDTFETIDAWVKDTAHHKYCPKPDTGEGHWLKGPFDTSDLIFKSISRGMTCYDSAAHEVPCDTWECKICGFYYDRYTGEKKRLKREINIHPNVKGDGVTDDKRDGIDLWGDGASDYIPIDTTKKKGYEMFTETIYPILPLRTLINDPLPELLIPLPDSCQLLRDSIKKLNDKLNTLQ